MTRRTLLPALLAILVGASPAHAWTWPADGPVLQRFTFDANPYVAGLHRGVDVAAPAGTPVRAPAAGTVSFAGTVPRHGRTVTIQTADGYAVTLVHLGGVAVSRGSPVAEGAVVGMIGPTGEAEHAVPYVHLGVRVAADPEGYVDPLLFLPPRELPPGTSGSSGGAGVATDEGPEPVAAGGAATPEGVEGTVEPDERAAATVPSPEREVAVPEAAGVPVAAVPVEVGAAAEAQAGAAEAPERADEAPGAAAEVPQPGAAQAPGLVGEKGDVAPEEASQAAAEDPAVVPAEMPSEAGEGEQAETAIDAPAPLPADAPVPVGPSLAGASTSPLEGPPTAAYDAGSDGQGDNAPHAAGSAVAPAPAGALPGGGGAADGRGVSPLAADEGTVDERSDVHSRTGAAATEARARDDGGGTRWLASAAIALAAVSVLLALALVRRTGSATRRRAWVPEPRRAAAASGRHTRTGELGVAFLAPTAEGPILAPLAPPAERRGDVEPLADEPYEPCRQSSSRGVSRACVAYGSAHRAPCRAGDGLGTRSPRRDAVACEREARRRPRRLVGLATGRRRRGRHAPRGNLGTRRVEAEA